MSESCCPTPAEPSSKTVAQGTEGESCCELHPPTTRGPAPCPSCGALGARVPRLTLGALLKSESRAKIPRQDEFFFCRTPGCEVAYFRPQEALFRKEAVRVPVHQKEPDDPTVPVCYCFGWTPEKISAELHGTGQSTAVEQIKAQVKAGNCYCEVTNPQGSCCLGNVAKVVGQAMALANKKGT